MGRDLEEVRAEAGGPLGGRAFLLEGDTRGVGQVVATYRNGEGSRGRGCGIVRIDLISWLRKGLVKTVSTKPSVMTIVS